MTNEKTLSLVRMSDVQLQEVKWLWKPYIPFGKLTIIQGNPGEGKTTFALRLAAACSSGEALPGMEIAEPFNVIYQTAEDGLGDTIKPRLIEAGADENRVLNICEDTDPLSLSDERIEQAIRQTNAGLMILDPIQGYIGERIDINRANEIRTILKKVSAVAERTGCTIIMVGHLNKAQGLSSVYRGLGSIDFRAAARSVLLVGRLRKEPNVRVIVHNTANDASAQNEVAYMIRNNKETSFHYAVDDKEIVQGIPLDRNSWNAGDGGNGKGNREGISIEICYSKSGGERFKTAQLNAAELTAKLLKDYGWGIDKVTKHADYSKKHCPHRTLDEYGWDYFLNLVKGFLDKTAENKKEEVKPTPTPAPAPKPVEVKYDVTYQVWDDVKNKWLPNVKNDSDYAGIFGHDICAVFANLSKGNIFYKVHYKGGKWLPEVKNRTDYAGLFNRPIDGLMMKTDTGAKIYYRVHLRRSGKWLPWVTGYSEKDGNNGYAGIIGQEIDGIQIKF